MKSNVWRVGVPCVCLESDATMRSLLPGARNTSGQHTQPTGLFYTGTTESWSNNTLREICKKHLPASARMVAVLDFHTGLGPTAYGEPIFARRTARSSVISGAAWFDSFPRFPTDARLVKEVMMQGDIFPALTERKDVWAVSH